MTIDVRAAADYATAAHGAQRRKYTGELYIHHCYEVEGLVDGYGLDDYTRAIALLHDTVEDTDVTVDDLEREFGDIVAAGVWYLTDWTYPAAFKPNRARRKDMDRNRLSHAPADVQTVKVCDLISNTKSIVEHDPKFAVTYLVEAMDLLDALPRANPDAAQRARDQIAAAWMTGGTL